MNSKTFIAICAIAVAGLPVHSHARVDRPGFSACATAVTERLAKAQGAPVDFYWLETDPKTAEKQFDTAGVWYLDAMNAKNREVVARINCHVNSRARVIRLKEVPMSANDARERAGME